MPEDTYFGKSDIIRPRVELFLVIAFAIVGFIMLSAGVILLIYGSTGGVVITFFGAVFLFVAYALAVEFDFIEGKGIPSI